VEIRHYPGGRPADDAAGRRSLHVTGGARIIGAANGGAEARRAVINRYGRRMWRWVRVCYRTSSTKMARSPAAREPGFLHARSFKHRSEIAWPIHTDRRFF
jgi:hypothetical protein